LGGQKLTEKLGVTDLRLLIVEDELPMLRLLKGMAQAFGISRIEEARSGEEGLIIARNFRPNFLLVDWEMSPMDGFTFVHHMRNARNGDSARVPVIMMSAKMEHARIEAARKIGVGYFIIKPIIPNNLLQRMQWLLAHPVPMELVDDQWARVPQSQLRPADL
jgi:two-component system, chemotaxis family, chemotaxis protein CheY